MSRAGREYPDRPWVGVGVVVWQGERVLLIRRGRAPRLGQWGLPGGAQSAGETLFEAAVREVLEETGLEVVPHAVVTALDSISRDDAGNVQFHYTLVEVVAECGPGEPVAADDAMDARWVPADRVGDLVEWDETVRVIEMSREFRASGFQYGGFSDAGG
ncbi:DNA mismatch repair protein MutT [Skermanella aerolata]|uniref:DNA mismatch repair protein MutT n=1 Tax=Skermanella aerolata TaxID=393310 RepID=A0A512E0F1_9PROT|nr:NUDIX hydrolase [Skermanella aerolata]KJB91746.1 phosphohydrolase [Skermanella aerolata KACC 11604]GEO42207.1 DNA mismatch repair protein MutT [Skermanella aerolata]